MTLIADHTVQQYDRLKLINVACMLRI